MLKVFSSFSVHVDAQFCCHIKHKAMIMFLLLLALRFDVVLWLLTINSSLALLKIHCVTSYLSQFMCFFFIFLVLSMVIEFRYPSHRWFMDNVIKATNTNQQEMDVNLCTLSIYCLFSPRVFFHIYFSLWSKQKVCHLPDVDGTTKLLFILW